MNYNPTLIDLASALIRGSDTTDDGVALVEEQYPGLGWHTLSLMDDSDLPTLPRPVWPPAATAVGVSGPI